MHPLVWLGAVLLIIGIPAAASVWVARISHRQKGHTEVLEEVREQVSNSHDTNFRDDVDRVDAKVDQVDTKVDRLTGSVDALTRTLENFMRESRASAARQDRIAAKYHPEEQ